MENAKQVKRIKTTIEEAVLIALECVRRTAIVNKVGAIPKVRIVPGDHKSANWKEIALRFNKHDKSKPFAQ